MIRSDLVEAVVAHARADHPDEACGVIAGPEGSDRPERHIAMLNAEANKALANPDVRKRLIDNGALITPGTPEDFDKLVRSEHARWKKVVTESKLVVD